MKNYTGFNLISLMLYLYVNWACTASSITMQKDFFEYTSSDSVVFYSEYDISAIVNGAIQNEENVLKESCSLLLHLEFEKQLGGVSTFRYF